MNDESANKYDEWESDELRTYTWQCDTNTTQFDCDNFDLHIQQITMLPHEHEEETKYFWHKSEIQDGCPIWATTMEAIQSDCDRVWLTGVHFKK